MLRFASARPSLQGLQPLAPRRRAPRLAAQRAPSAVMGGYQYQARADQLRSRGVDVYEFGGRVLREGCFGEDVLQLQNWLAEESYYSPVDGGYTGYFGAVTRESLQAWQKDNAVEASGAFDAASKWTYLRTVEARAEATQQATAVPTVAASAPTQTAPASTSVSSGAVVLLLAVAMAGFALWKRYFSAKGGSSSFLVSLKKAKGASPLSALAPVLASSDLNTTASEGEEAAAVSKGEGEEESSKAGDSAFKPSSPSGLRRLSDDELQRYIAPFKGGGKAAVGVGGGAPARGASTQRIAPRPLVLSPEAANKTDASAKGAASSAPGGSAAASRHGTYFGGRQVLDRVKDYLIEEGGLTVAPGSAEDRLQHLSYDMRAKRGTKARNTGGGDASAVPSSPSRKAQKSRQNQPQQQQIVFMAPEESSYVGSGSFEDVPVQQQQQQQKLRMPASAGPAISFGTAELLSGTDLEDSPDRPLRPVPVQRTGRAAAAPVATVTVVQQGTKRPVPVVRSAKAVGGEADKADTAAAVAAAADPNSVMVLHTKPVKLHKPARLARTLDLSDLGDA